jgi:hypothetical protein
MSFSSSYSITNLGRGGLFRSQQSCRLVISWVVVQVVVFLLDDNLEVVSGDCCPFYEHVGANCVCRDNVFLLRVWHGILLKFLRSFCSQEECNLLFAVNITFLRFEAYLCYIAQISLPYKKVGRANVLYNFNFVLLWTKFGFNVLFKNPSTCKKNCDFGMYVFLFLILNVTAQVCESVHLF